MRSIVAGLVAVALAFGSALAAVAQESEVYPSRPVRMIVAAAPGGNPDVLARLLAQKLTDALGKPFVVENVPGAGGVVAAKAVAAAPPDGHVLMFGDSGAMAINIALDPNLTYHPLRDFTPVTALATVPTVLVAHPSVPANTIEEFVAMARSQPGRMTYGSAGAGSIHHLTMAIFADRAGIDLLHVPYRGGTALVNGLLTGEIQVGWSGFPNVKSLIESGQLKAYCVSIPHRSQTLPHVPTCIERGFDGFDLASMIGLQLPAGAAPQLVARLQAEVAKAIRDPAIAQRMQTLGMEMQERGTAHYQAFMKEDLERYAVAIPKLKIQVK